MEKPNHSRHIKIVLIFVFIIFVASACISSRSINISTELPSTSQAVEATSSPISTQSPYFPLSGRWAGIAQNGTFIMQVAMDFNSTCNIGEVCGRFNLATIPCAGTYILVNKLSGVFEFHAGDFSGTCDEGKDYLTLRADDTVLYSSQGDYGTTEGILSRVFPVIYDDDGSPDGTTALMYLLSDPIVDLKMVSISYGEAHPQKYIQLIGGQLDEFGMTDIPLGEGQDGPLSGNNEFPEWLRQIADNFWGLPIPVSNHTYPVQNSAQLMVNLLNSTNEPIAIFISGPCTNLAAALRLDPSIKEHIRSVTIMGGAVYVRGNLSDLLPDPTNQVAEWNIWSDPQAAYEVFNSGLQIDLVPLDATNQVEVGREDIALWRDGAEPAVFAADMYDKMLESNSLDKFAIWDIMTAEIMVRPALCGFTDLSLEVVTATGGTNGQTRITSGGLPNVHVCLQPDIDQIKQTLDDVFASRR